MTSPQTAAVRLLAGDKEPVRAATTANITLSGLQTVDGVVLVAGDRVLVKDQTDATTNGIYTASEGTWRRAPDSASNRTLIKAMKVAIQEGTAHGGDVWNLDTDRPDLGVDDIEFSFYLNTDTVDQINEARETLVDEAAAIIAMGVGAGKASQAEAEAGVTNVPWMTPLRTAQAIAAASAASPIAVKTVADVTALKAVDTTLFSSVFLRAAGREGIFHWKTGNYTSHIAADTNNGVYVKANAIAASSGAWVRQFDFQNYWSKWFGAVDDHSTDNTSIINNMMTVANLQNTNSSAGKQSAAYLNVEGGVRFNSQNLSMLPSVNWIFIYLCYWGNSDRTPGQVSYGTNEKITLSLNSGYPGDATGAWVAEEMFNAPLHPALGVNIHKNIDNSVAVHSGPTQRIQPTSSASAKGSVAYIKDENKDIFRIAHEHYGTVSSVNGTLFYVNIHQVVIAITNGGVVAGWGSSSVPVAGDVVRDISTGGRAVVTALATNQLTCDWLSGAAVAGNTLMVERAIFKGSISGTTLTVTSILQGALATGHTIVGMFNNHGITTSTTITGQLTGSAGSTGTYSINNSQTISATEMVSGFLSVNGIQGGGVTNNDTTNIPIMFGLDGLLYFKDTFLLRSRTSLAANNGAATATLTNSPTAGNPTKWLRIDDNGTTRYIPAW